MDAEIPSAISGGSSSSTAVLPSSQVPGITSASSVDAGVFLGTGLKREAEVDVRDLADHSCGSTTSDIMSIDVGAAFIAGPDGSISEIYSPPRVVPHANKRGFRGGWSLDLTTCDSEGKPWDFSLARCRQAARQLVQDTRPLLLIGSPMCTWFSLLQNLNPERKQSAE